MTETTSLLTDTDGGDDFSREGSAVRQVLKDLALIRQSRRLGWPTTPEKSEQVLGKVMELLDNADETIALSAAKTYVAIMAQNQKDIHLIAKLSAKVREMDEAPKGTVGDFVRDFALAAKQLRDESGDGERN